MNKKEEFLRNNGVDFDSAMTYMGDLETFDEILKDFYDGIDDQIRQLEDCKNNSDMTNYAIYVHALKSNYRSLGITALAQTAYNHELESKQNNINYVNEHFNDLVEDKEKFKTFASNYMNL